MSLFSWFNQFTNSLWIYVVTSWVLGISWRTDFGLIATKQLRNTGFPATAKAWNPISTSVQQMIQYFEPYLVITSHELRHRMQNTFASELLWCCRFPKYVVDFHLLFSLHLCCLHLLPYIARDCMVILWYVVIFAALLVYLIMTTYMGSTRWISTSKESGPLPVFQIRFFSILWWAFLFKCYEGVY